MPSSSAHWTARTKYSSAFSGEGMASPNGVPDVGQPVSLMMTCLPPATRVARRYISFM